MQVACLLLLALAGSRAHEGQEGDETVWLSTLPAPAWLLHAAKVGETALLNPVGWLLLLELVRFVANRHSIESSAAAARAERRFGELQLARLALIHEPSIVILDEPTTALDPQSSSCRRSPWTLHDAGVSRSIIRNRCW